MDLGIIKKERAQKVHLYLYESELAALKKLAGRHETSRSRVVAALVMAAERQIAKSEDNKVA